MPIKEFLIVVVLITVGQNISRNWHSIVPPTTVIQAAHCLDFLKEEFCIDDPTITVTADEVEEVRIGMLQRQLSQQ